MPLFKIIQESGSNTINNLTNANNIHDGTVIHLFLSYLLFVF